LTNASRHRAADWGSEIRWSGSMRITSVNEQTHIYFESEGKLFGRSDITKEGAVEPGHLTTIKQFEQIL